MINIIHDDDGSEPGVRRVRIWPLLRRARGRCRGCRRTQVSTCARIRLIGDMGLTTKGDFPGTMPGDHRPVDTQQPWQPPGRGTRTGIRGLSDFHTTSHH